MLRLVLPLLVLAVVLFGYQNCGSFHSVYGSASSSSGVTGNNSPTANGTGGTTTLQVDPTLQTQAVAILTNQCASCHENVTNGGVTQILDVNHLIATGLIVVGDPNQGQLLASIESGIMPPGGTVAAADLQTLKNWISSMKLVSSGTGTGTTSSTAPPPPLPPGKVVNADPTLHLQAMSILNINCAGCHEGVTNGGVTGILDINNLVATGLVVAGDPTKGSLLASIENGLMPAGNGARVTAADLQTLKNWISSMTIVNASGQAPLPTRPPLSATFTGVFTNIIQPKCFACHGPVLHDDATFTTYSQVANSAGDILNQCQNGNMPRAPYPALTATELSALQGWINNGKPNN